MKRIILILGLAASMGLTGTGSVHAQFVVHDPGHTPVSYTHLAKEYLLGWIIAVVVIMVAFLII